MEAALLQEILACLRGERTVFHYCPDQYAVYLIRRVLNQYKRVGVRDLRNSRWSSLMSRPAIRELITHCGDGYLYPEVLEDFWLSEPEPFVLTLGQWGARNQWTWSQTSRPGSNLVLQLNLSRKWCRRFCGVVQQTANEFLGFAHPISDSRSATLAWVRMDFDFETDEVLIEEIQSDLVREIASIYKLARFAAKQESFSYYGDTFKTVDAISFSEMFLSTFGKIWHEAMLAAALFFVFDELGFSRLYYHSFETGNKMKNLRWSKPPRSLYSDLPKKFCFEKVEHAPEFLQREKTIRRKLKKLEKSCWFYMAA